MKPGTLEDTRTKRLKRLLGLPLWQASGVLSAFWYFLAEHSETGHLCEFDAEDIADHLEWHDSPAKLLDALVASGWVIEAEGRLLAAEWDVRQPKHVRDRLRKRNVRGQSADIPRNSDEDDGQIEKEERGVGGGVELPAEKGAHSEEAFTLKAQPSRKPAGGEAAFGLLMVAWNQTPGTSECKSANDERKRRFATRLKETFFREHWQQALDKFPLPMFTDRDDSKWVPTVDWFLRPGNVDKIIEGAFDSKLSDGSTHGRQAVKRPGLVFDPNATCDFPTG